MIHDENEFLLLRRQLFNQPTVNEHRRAARIAKNIDYNNFDPNIDPLVKEKLLKRRERANYMLLHYTHEKRFSHYKRAIHKIWHDKFHNTPIQTTKLIVGSRNNPNLCKELVRRNPFLKKPKTKEYNPTTN